jgi:hypothetical protein
MLAGRDGSSPVDVVHRLLAVQAQDERGFRLAIRSRSVGLHASDVDRALDDGALVVTWLNRGTLHLVTADDYRWLHPLLAPRIVVRNALRLRQEGVDPRETERDVETIVDAVTSDGPQTREQLGRRVRRTGQALVHLLVEASIRGYIVRGPMVGGQHAYVSVRSWIGDLEPPDLARLGARYRAGHGPADARDLAKWAGIPLAQARAALAGADEVRRPAPVGIEPRLLGAFDPLLHGWASREGIVGDHAEVVTTNGIFRPVVLVDGRAVGTWGLPAKVPVLNLWEQVSAKARGQLRAEADDVVRYLGLTSSSTRRAARPGC